MEPPFIRSGTKNAINFPPPSLPKRRETPVVGRTGIPPPIYAPSRNKCRILTRIVRLSRRNDTKNGCRTVRVDIRQDSGMRIDSAQNIRTVAAMCKLGCQYLDILTEFWSPPWFKRAWESRDRQDNLLAAHRVLSEIGSIL